MLSTSYKGLLVSRILLIDGVLLIIVAFIHILSTPLISKWLTRELSSEAVANISPPFLLDHLVVGVLLIPFGVSTIYSAAGVRSGQRWARIIAMTNAVAVLSLPVLLILLMGLDYFTAIPFLIASILITLVGFSMIIPLLWLSGGSGNRGN